MIPRRLLLKSATALAALSLAIPVAAQSEPTRVVATFSILGDMAERIGGDAIAVTTPVGPNGDAHVYQPTPAAARAVSEADVLLVNGLEFEGWLDRLIATSEFDGLRVVATTGIDPISFDDEHRDDHDEEHADHDAEQDDHYDHDAEHAEHEDHGDEHAHHHHGAFDPHAWQSLGNAVTYVDNITAALAQSDPDNAAAFYENCAAYVAEIKTLDAENRDIVAQLPPNSRTVVTSHDAFQYFGRDYGLTFLAPQGPSTESEASAQDVARLIEQMREDSISAVFIENMSDSRLLDQMARETGAAIGGTPYPDALSDAGGPAPTFLDMMRHNAQTLAQAQGS